MPNPVKNYAMPRLIKIFSVILAVSLGAGYAFGPDAFSSTPLFTYAKELFPIQVWGILFMTCGVILAITKFFGYALSAIMWGLWGIYLVIAALDGHLQSWGAVLWPFYFAAVNFMHVALWGQERRRQMRQQRG